MLAKALFSAGSRGGRPVVAIGVEAGAWLEAAGVPGGACPLTSTVGLARGARAVGVCGVAVVPPALFWRIIPDVT